MSANVINHSLLAGRMNLVDAFRPFLPAASLSSPLTDWRVNSLVALDQDPQEVNGVWSWDTPQSWEGTNGSRTWGKLLGQGDNVARTPLSKVETNEPFGKRICFALKGEGHI
jgi:hypothetical protein